MSTQKGISAKRHTSTPGGSNGNHQPRAVHNVATEPKKKRGRKPGKHSNENYTQTSIYLPIELRNRVRSKLYEKGMEMSGLVEDMLRDWLAKAKD